ncbi:CRAL-TRIO domain-containing protein C34C12.6 [Toxocara canis]|uniref:CRAL-TRIO domain-containing protein C34C12.6 n=1 Tax=Toxocara canis TaxID=6265 RepID=A0A0B2VDZ0_TOXCA|nr:CRAL-TRIO domain-containing protein C34C12.6 [Toxocara canis]
MLTPPTITNAEIAGAKLIRSRIKGIPTEFDTDFYLARWWRAYDGDIKAIERRMREVFEHRRTFGYDRLDTKLFDTKIDFARKTFERFSISTVWQEHYSENVSVFIQRMSGVDLREITKVIPLSYVIHSYYMLLESFTRAVLAREAVTGNAGAAVVVLDLDGLNITDFLNPLSAPAKLARLTIKVWSDYFSETLIKAYIINSPAILSVMWQVTKLIMDKKTQSRLTFLDKPSDLLNHLSEKVIPECYGGARRDDSGYADPPETACRRAIRVTPQQYYDIDDLWRRHGFERMPSEITTITIKGKHAFEVIKMRQDRPSGGIVLKIKTPETEHLNAFKSKTIALVKKLFGVRSVIMDNCAQSSGKCEHDGQSLVWHFTVNGDVEFEVVRLDGNSETVMWPKITLTTLKSPEQGAIVCKRGDYRLRFVNPTNTWIPLKVHYVIELNNV